MLFSNNSKPVTLRTYYGLVNQLVENNDDTYKKLIDKIILETVKVSSDHGKSLNEVDPGIFYIVNQLYKFNHSYFSGLTASSALLPEVYKTLNDFLLTLSQGEAK